MDVNEQLPIPGYLNTQEKPNKDRFFNLIFICLIALILIGSSFYVYNKLSSKIKTVSVATDAYAGWKVYNNTKYYYALKYPNIWHIDQSQSDTKIPLNGSIEFISTVTFTTPQKDTLSIKFNDVDLADTHIYQYVKQIPTQIDGYEVDKVYLGCLTGIATSCNNTISRISYSNPIIVSSNTVADTLFFMNPGEKTISQPSTENELKRYIVSLNAKSGYPISIIYTLHKPLSPNDPALTAIDENIDQVVKTITFPTVQQSAVIYSRLNNTVQNQSEITARNNKRISDIQSIGLLITKYKNSHNNTLPSNIPTLLSTQNDSQGFNKDTQLPDCQFVSITLNTINGCMWADQLGLVLGTSSISIDTGKYSHYFIALTYDKKDVVVMSASMENEIAFPNLYNEGIYYKEY